MYEIAHNFQDNKSSIVTNFSHLQEPMEIRAVLKIFFIVEKRRYPELSDINAINLVPSIFIRKNTMRPLNSYTDIED